MKTKHRLLSLLTFGAIIALLAYSAGAKNNQLSSQQMSFSSLSSNQNNNQLKAHMRDALISKLNTRASNHELRIATYAQSSSHPQLSSQQLSFNSYLSTNNNNMLTAHMRDNLTTQFGNTISNHEMRIRCIEDGSCLNTSHCPPAPSCPTCPTCPTCSTTSTPPAQPEAYHCVGSYTTTSKKWTGKVNTNSFECRDREGIAYDPACCRRSIFNPSDDPHNHIEGGSSSNCPRNKNIQWRIRDPSYTPGQYIRINPSCLLEASDDPVIHDPNDLSKYTCHYRNCNQNSHNPQYCIETTTQTSHSCSSLSTQAGCKAQSGCSRVKK